jgi:ribosomal protein L37E
MDRCPHCASPRPTSPTCRVCGLPVEAGPGLLAAVADGAALAGLEPTRVSPVHVQVTRLDGLETTQEVRGDVSIPVDETEAPALCRRCGAPATGTGFCERCGYAVRPLAPGRAGDEPPTLRCLVCGTPNHFDTAVCAACGQRLNP